MTKRNAFDWSDWAKNFPIAYRYLELQDDYVISKPPVIDITRASNSIQLTFEELEAIYTEVRKERNDNL